MSSSDPAAAAMAYAFRRLERPVSAWRNPDDVLSAAYAEADGIRAEAQAQGAAEGRAAGLAAAAEEVRQAVAALHGAAAEFRARQDELTLQVQDDAAALALGLAEQVVAGALAIAPERVLDLVRSGLRRLADRRHVTVVVNPVDLERVREAVPELGGELGGIDHCDVQGDRRIAPGGAIVRTAAGEVDVTVAAQLQSAREIVEAELRGGGEGG